VLVNNESKIGDAIKG